MHVVRLWSAVWLALLIGSAQQPETSASVESTRILNLNGSTYHVQGIDFDAQVLWVTSVDSSRRKGYLHEFALDRGSLLRSVEVQDGSGSILAGSRPTPALSGCRWPSTAAIAQA